MPEEDPFKTPPQIALVTNGGQAAPRNEPARQSPRREEPTVPPPGGQNEDERRQGPEPPRCHLSSEQAAVPCGAGPLAPCPLHRPQDGHSCDCGALFCAVHARQTSASGHEGQSLSATPQAAHERGKTPEPGDARQREEAGAGALVATAVAQEGRPGLFPYVDANVQLL